MSQADIPEVASLAAQLGYPVSPQDIETRFREISANASYALFVAKDEGSVLGWIQINREAASLIIADYAEVAALVVEEKCRGKGAGKLLLQEAEKWAKQNHVKLIRIRSSVKRTGAHRFYLREGYQISKISNTFTKSCE